MHRRGKTAMVGRVENDIVVRPVLRSDSRRVWAIRNTPEFLTYFNTAMPTEFREHDVWFEKKYFQGGGNYCFVAVSGGEVCGYCRFDKIGSAGGFLLSIALDSSLRGKGFGLLLLTEALRALPPRAVVRAEVKKNNPSSLRFFEKAGFTVEREAAEKVFFALPPRAV